MMRMPWPEAVTLEGRHVRLEPLSQTHAAALREAVKDGELWRLWYTAIPNPEGMEAEIARRLGLRDAGSMLPFAVISLATGEPVGMRTYMNTDAGVRRGGGGSAVVRRVV